MDQFDALQEKLIHMWKEIGSTVDAQEDDERTIVVVPSIKYDMDLPPSGMQAYEERMLFLLFLLRKPSVRMIFVTSQPIQTEIIDYYLQLIPGVIPSSTRKRLFLVSPEDGSLTPLSRKLLNRPHLIRHIRSLIPDMDRAHIVPFMTTEVERELAVALGIPMYAADPRFFAFGTKSGGRRIFEEEGVQHPLGIGNLRSLDDVVNAIATMRTQRPTLQKVVVKLDEGVSGLGNALLDVSGLPAPSSADEREAIRNRIPALQLESDERTYQEYIEKLSDGAIVEEFIVGTEIRSPSAQLRVTPAGEVETLSTHDQMLGGPSGQSYLGAIFPADPAYSGMIMRDAYKIGQRFAKEGIVGRFAVDFVVSHKDDGSWESYAIEVNLRKGGTTAPFLILQYLTDGTFDPDAGIFKTAQGEPRYYVASDHVESHDYHVFTVDRLFEIFSNYQLHFNHATQTGVVLHMITGIAELGRVGITVIEKTPQTARDLFRQFGEILDQEAAILLEP